MATVKHLFQMNLSSDRLILSTYMRVSLMLLLGVSTLTGIKIVIFFFSTIFNEVCDGLRCDENKSLPHPPHARHTQFFQCPSNH